MSTIISKAVDESDGHFVFDIGSQYSMSTIRSKVKDIIQDPERSTVTLQSQYSASTIRSKVFRHGSGIDLGYSLSQYSASTIISETTSEKPYLARAPGAKTGAEAKFSYAKGQYTAFLQCVHLYFIKISACIQQPELNTQSFSPQLPL